MVSLSDYQLQIVMGATAHMQPDRRYMLELAAQYQLAANAMAPMSPRELLIEHLSVRGGRRSPAYSKGAVGNSCNRDVTI